MADSTTGVLVWITGLAGSGKSTIGKLLYERLKARHPNTLLLDGDSFREIMDNDLAHTSEARKENAMRIARMCQFLTQQGMIVICATMSLFSEVHDFNRKHIAHYYEIFIDVSLEELVRRDQKNLYSQALAGEAKNVVGVDLPYDMPAHCDLIIDNNEPGEPERKAEAIMAILPAFVRHKSAG